MVETMERRDLPCANPNLVDEYVAIDEILQGRSSDFTTCHICGIALCEHALNEKRADESYKVLVQHFRDGGPVNQPLAYKRRDKEQSNGHHRLVAALDAGFTHVPVRHTGWGEDADWTGTDLKRYGFQMDIWGDGVEEIPMND